MIMDMRTYLIAAALQGYNLQILARDMATSNNYPVCWLAVDYNSSAWVYDAAPTQGNRGETWACDRDDGSVFFGWCIFNGFGVTATDDPAEFMQIDNWRELVMEVSL